MNFDADDIGYLDKKFDKVHERVDDLSNSTNDSINGLALEVNTLKAATCKDVVAHVKDRHNMGKFIGMWAGILGTAIAAAALIMSMAK